MSPEKRAEIAARLREIEAQEGVRVLYACESGSRAWGFLNGIRALMPVYYPPRSCLYHYLHMARGNIREYLKGERVWVKKYLYVLRPLLACLWIEADRGVVPMEFTKLVRGLDLDSDLRTAIDRILQDKLAGREMDDGPRVSVFHDFFDREIPRIEKTTDTVPPGPKADLDRLDRFFRCCIGHNLEERGG